MSNYQQQQAWQGQFVQHFSHYKCHQALFFPSTCASSSGKMFMAFLAHAGHRGVHEGSDGQLKLLDNGHYDET